MTLDSLFANRNGSFFATRSSSGQPPCEGFVHYTSSGAIVTRPQHRKYQKKIVVETAMPQLHVFSLPAKVATAKCKRRVHEPQDNICTTAVLWCAVQVLPVNVMIVGLHLRFHQQHGDLSWYIPFDETYIIELPKVRKGFAMWVAHRFFLTGQEFLQLVSLIQTWWRKLGKRRIREHSGKPSTLKVKRSRRNKTS